MSRASRFLLSKVATATCLSAVAAVVGLAISADALAESCPRTRRREAEQHKQAGWKLVTDDPARASEELEKANELCPDPFYLGTLAVCYERLGRYRDAMKALDEYLEHPGVPQREQAIAARARLGKLFGTVSIASEPTGAELMIDGFPRIPPLVTPTKVDLPPGDHSIEAVLEGFQSQSRSIVVDGGAEVDLNVTLEPVAPEPPAQELETGTEPAPEPTPRDRTLRWTGALQISVGWLFPIGSDGLLSAVGLGGDVSGGLGIGLVRVELVGFVSSTPDADGYLLEAGGGPRVAVRLGSLPLLVEAELLLGLCYLSAAQSGLVIPAGSYASLAFVPALSLVWAPLRWLEVVARPMRLELLGLAGELPGGVTIRYGLEVGVRFRL
jgi:tetratricopeptide (TPR) repeat protein